MAMADQPRPLRFRAAYDCLSFLPERRSFTTGRPMPKPTRRRFFGLAAAPVAASMPAIAAPVMEMHENDVRPLITIRRPEHVYNYMRSAGVEYVALEPKPLRLVEITSRFAFDGKSWVRHG